MAAGDAQEEILIGGLGDKEFVATLLGLLDGVRERYRGKLDATPKKGGISEHSLLLLVSNGACLALNELKNEIKRLHDVALERP
jgi:hypothetical protein